MKSRAYSIPSMIRRTGARFRWHFRCPGCGTREAFSSRRMPVSKLRALQELQKLGWTPAPSGSGKYICPSCTQVGAKGDLF